MCSKLFRVLLIIACMVFPSACGSASISEADLTAYTDDLAILDTHPHDTNSFTEGLFCLDGQLYESTGLYGQSRLLKHVSLDTGLPEDDAQLSDDLFGEGCVYFHDYIYVLTYKEHVALLFHPETLALEKTYAYPREGWGLTTDGEYLIAGDGTSKLYYLDDQMNTVRTLHVTYNGRKLENLNELEFIDGYIWANVWEKDYIAIIHPESGEVERLLSFADLVPSADALKSSESVLNGIAYNPDTDTVYITGKNWPILYELEWNRS